MKAKIFKRSPSIDNSVPIYIRVQKAILDEIEEGTWKPGELIPTEAEIAQTYQVSVGTVKKGILNLVNEGYLYRVLGKGTFVAGTSFAVDQLRYHHFYTRLGGEEAELQMQLLSLKTANCPKAARRLFGVDTGSKAYKLERLTLCGNSPMIYIISYLQKEILSNLEAFSKTRFERIPLYTLIEREYGLPTISNHELICAVQATEHLAKILSAKQGAPLLQIEMVAYTYKEVPYEYRISYCVTDQWKLFRAI